MQFCLGSPENAFQPEKLKEVPEEIDTLHRLWSNKIPARVKKCLIPVDGTPAQAGVSLDKWHEFGLIHIACHGEFPDDRPFDAALRLGSEALRASEFFATRLNAALVSLSACSLGRRAGRHAGVEIVGDEWVGLTLPLLYAGAESLLVSIWDANSETAAILMPALHQALSEGTAPIEALQKGILAVHKRPAPLWANWYLVGLPG
jgi:CHAT domain-containing protein